MDEKVNTNNKNSNFAANAGGYQHQQGVANGNNNNIQLTHPMYPQLTHNGTLSDEMSSISRSRNTKCKHKRKHRSNQKQYGYKPLTRPYIESPTDSANLTDIGIDQLPPEKNIQHPKESINNLKTIDALSSKGDNGFTTTVTDQQNLMKKGNNHNHYKSRYHKYNRLLSKKRKLQNNRKSPEYEPLSNNDMIGNGINSIKNSKTDNSSIPHSTDHYHYNHHINSHLPDLPQRSRKKEPLKNVGNGNRNVFEHPNIDSPLGYLGNITNERSFRPARNFIDNGQKRHNNQSDRLLEKSQRGGIDNTFTQLPRANDVGGDLTKISRQDEMKIESNILTHRTNPNQNNLRRINNVNDFNNYNNYNNFNSNVHHAHDVNNLVGHKNNNNNNNNNGMEANKRGSGYNDNNYYYVSPPNHKEKRRKRSFQEAMIDGDNNHNGYNSNEYRGDNGNNSGGFSNNRSFIGSNINVSTSAPNVNINAAQMSSSSSNNIDNARLGVNAHHLSVPQGVAQIEMNGRPYEITWKSLPPTPERAQLPKPQFTQVQNTNGSMVSPNLFNNYSSVNVQGNNNNSINGNINGNVIDTNSVRNNVNNNIAANTFSNVGLGVASGALQLANSNNNNNNNNNVQVEGVKELDEDNDIVMGGPQNNNVVNANIPTQIDLTQAGLRAPTEMERQMAQKIINQFNLKPLQPLQSLQSLQPVNNGLVDHMTNYGHSINNGFQENQQNVGNNIAVPSQQLLTPYQEFMQITNGKGTWDEYCLFLRSRRR